MSKVCPCRGEKGGVCGERRPDRDEDVPLLEDKVEGQESEPAGQKTPIKFTTSDRKSWHSLVIIIKI